MSALVAMTALLLADDDVVAIVDDRVSIVLPPQEWIRPQLVLHLKSTVGHNLISGAGGHYRSRVQVDCNSDAPSSAVRLGDAVMECLDGVVKAVIGGCKDVDVLHAGVDFTEFVNQSDGHRRVLEFSCVWRSA